MRGDERRVVDAFCAWLRENGWQAETEVAFADVVATRGDERMHAEAKGRTAAPGLDVDTLYGQLLRRMRPEELANPRTRFGVVVPEGPGRTAALRVPSEVRARLRVDVYVVYEDGRVEPVAG